ncbi:MAG: PKD domain-containing protein [Maribacter sp.]|nr:PKD domain-containing protein [Maribacter sp.]
MKKGFFLTVSFFLLFPAIVNGQCDNVDITSISDDFENSGPVIGNGTASCDELVVVLSCAQELANINAFNSIFKDIGVVNGNWEATFSASEIVSKKCGCGDNMIMLAFCKGDQTCPATVKKFKLCGEDECPEINITPSPISCADKNADGDFAVDFTINASGGLFTGLYNVTFGDGTNQVIPSTTTNPLTITHTYSCPNSNQTYFVSILAVGCESDINHTSNDTVPISFPDCGCPDMSDISSTVSSDNGCEVDFDVEVNGCLPMDMQYIWNFGDGTTEFSTTSNYTYTYAQNGTYDVSVCITGFGSSCCVDTTVDITNCSTGGGDDDDDDEDDDNCFFCFCVDFWCCIAYILFIIAFFTLLSSLAYALCNGGTAAWVVFGVSLAAILVLVPILIWVCDLDFCQLLISFATVGTINWAIVCGTNIIIPVTCKTWLCSQHSIGILGIQVSGFLIVNLVLWLLALLFCVT